MLIGWRAGCVNRFEDKGEVWSINKVAFGAGSMHAENNLSFSLLIGNKT